MKYQLWAISSDNTLGAGKCASRGPEGLTLEAIRLSRGTKIRTKHQNTGTGGRLSDLQASRTHKTAFTT
jgi:hypothetical protein